MDTIAELRIAQAARQAIEAAYTKIADVLDEATREIHALQLLCASDAVTKSLMRAQDALDGDNRCDCLNAIDRILTDELTPDPYLETLVEEEQPAIGEVDAFDACRALSDSERALIGLRT
jgi:hypothetical protein